MGMIFSTIFHHLPWQSSMDTPAASRRRQVLRMPNVEAKVLRTSPGKRLKAILASQLFQAPCDGGAATGFSFWNCWVYLGIWWFSYGKLWKMNENYGTWWDLPWNLVVLPWTMVGFAMERVLVLPWKIGIRGLSKGESSTNSHSWTGSSLRLIESTWNYLLGGDWNHGILWLSRNSWECPNPNWRTHICQRGWNHQPVMTYTKKMQKRVHILPLWSLLSRFNF